MAIQNNMTDAAISQQMNSLSNQGNKPKSATQNTYDKNRYFNVSLSPGEEHKDMFIRLLPISPTAATPFIQVKAHNVPFKTKDGKKSTKPYICPTETDPNADCPFCRKSKEGYAAEDAMKAQLSAAMSANGGVVDMATKTSYEKQIEQFHEIGVSNMARQKFIVRLIERGKESEGVKFWMFDSSRKNDGYYDKIKRLYEAEKKLGRNQNIFDLNTGCDIYISIDRGSDGKKVLQFNVDQPSPLSADDSQAYAWLNDAQTWDRMWTTKPLDYLEILAAGGEPIYDKVSGRYVDKGEMERSMNGQTFSDATRAPQYGQQEPWQNQQWQQQQTQQPQPQPWQQQQQQQVQQPQPQPWQQQYQPQPTQVYDPQYGAQQVYNNQYRTMSQQAADEQFDGIIGGLKNQIVQ